VVYCGVLYAVCVMGPSKYFGPRAAESLNAALIIQLISLQTKGEEAIAYEA